MRSAGGAGVDEEEEEEEEVEDVVGAGMGSLMSASSM